MVLYCGLDLRSDPSAETQFSALATYQNQDGVCANLQAADTNSAVTRNNFSFFTSLERIIIDDYEFDVINVSDTRIEMVKMKKLK